MYRWEALCVAHEFEPGPKEEVVAFCPASVPVQYVGHGVLVGNEAFSALSA